MHKDRPDGVAISFGEQREILEDPACTFVPGNYVKALIEEIGRAYSERVQHCLLAWGEKVHSMVFVRDRNHAACKQKEVAALACIKLQDAGKTFKHLIGNRDPQKMAGAIINLTNQEAAPLRLALGSDTYTLLKAKLPLRLEQLEANKDITLSTDADDQDETASRWRELLPES